MDVVIKAGYQAGLARLGSAQLELARYDNLCCTDSDMRVGHDTCRTRYVSDTTIRHFPKNIDTTTRHILLRLTSLAND